MAERKAGDEQTFQPFKAIDYAFGLFVFFGSFYQPMPVVSSTLSNMPFSLKLKVLKYVTFTRIILE